MYKISTIQPSKPLAGRLIIGNFGKIWSLWAILFWPKPMPLTVMMRVSRDFKLPYKPYIQRRDGSAKGDWDDGMTI